MSDPAPEPSIAQLSAKIEDVVLGLKWMISLLILLLTIPNVVTVMFIENFRQLFADALPGKPLPAITVALFSVAGMFRFLTIAWPVLALLNNYFSKSLRQWVVGSVIILFLIALQLVLTWIGFLMPMMGMPVGMSEQTGK